MEISGYIGFERPYDTVNVWNADAGYRRGDAHRRLQKLLARNELDSSLMGRAEYSERIEGPIVYVTCEIGLTENELAVGKSAEQRREDERQRVLAACDRIEAACQKAEGGPTCVN